MEVVAVVVLAMEDLAAEAHQRSSSVCGVVFRLDWTVGSSGDGNIGCSSLLLQ